MSIQLREITSTTRVNSPTFERLTREEILMSVKKKLLKKLYDSLIDSNVIDISSEPTGKGSVVFHAKLKVCERDAA